MAVDNIGRHLLDLDVRRHAYVLDYPTVFRGPDRQVRRRHPAAIHQHREAEYADQPAPGALADELAQAKLAPHPGQEIAARSGGLVDQHYLGTLNGSRRRFEIRAVTHSPIRRQRTAKNVDVVVGRLTAAVETLVYDDRFLVGLRVEVALEVGVPLRGCVRHINIRHAAAGCFVDLLQIPLDPVAIPQRGFVGDGHDLDRSRTRTIGIGTDGDLDDLA